MWNPVTHTLGHFLRGDPTNSSDGICVRKIDTHDQLADLFTKPLAKDVFEQLRKKMIGWWRPRAVLLFVLIATACFTSCFRCVCEPPSRSMISPDLPRLNAARAVSNSLTHEPARQILESAWPIRRAQIASQHDPSNCSHFFYGAVHVTSSRFHSCCYFFSSHNLHCSKLRIHFACIYSFVCHPPCRTPTNPMPVLLLLLKPTPLLGTNPTTIPSAPFTLRWTCTSQATKGTTSSTAASRTASVLHLAKPPSDNASPRTSARD